ncbi:uncharacterized protein YdeI (YjbR/CyaY-like superfamily) [Allocatelliglobosispora scoriae]|uniref:Uncharacterized protein YdeI (YjbR/CyaY-like superfamily) n=1 Tax=Allocatelliglobosispora scoriae TaxID=643052 RepID=A0A841BZF6_9ACTN|nr:YdeI/OmpD-associated family protein [Allocatelliglobosispora scoriae]MBB5872479.1 uncharacterized protein YdeI (YjbR/CyaY-like superfamily) [Allocatelliglobosispora scoriae]
MTADTDPTLAFASRAEFASWLDEQHGTSDGVWLKLAKKESGIPSVTYAEALEVSLCYGWIDGHKRAVDEQFWVQRFTPRRARSKWSRINRDKAVELIASGAMRPAGLREVEAAKADGRWEAAYESQANATVPDDLRAALDAVPAAAAFFATLKAANRYAILYRVQDAKRPETRAKRIADYVAMCAEGRTLH